jgi:hypothetical protein
MYARESTQASDAEAEDHLQHAVQLAPEHEGLILEKITPVATGDSVSSLRANASLLATSPQTFPQNDTQASAPHFPQQARAGGSESAAQRHQGCPACLLQPTTFDIMHCSGPSLEESFSDLIGTGFTSEGTDWAIRLQLENNMQRVESGTGKSKSTFSGAPVAESAKERMQGKNGNVKTNIIQHSAPSTMPGAPGWSALPYSLGSPFTWDDPWCRCLDNDALERH